MEIVTPALRFIGLIGDAASAAIRTGFRRWTIFFMPCPAAVARLYRACPVHEDDPLRSRLARPTLQSALRNRRHLSRN